MFNEKKTTKSSRLERLDKIEKETSLFSEILQFSLIAVFIVLPFRLFIAQPFIVNGASMQPTFATGEYLIVDQLSYKFSTPERGSVIIFKYPLDKSKYFIKRIIGLPGESVSINGSKVTIKNNEYPEGFVLDEPYIIPTTEDHLDYTLGVGEYFVMGDNRIGSSDSRIWGPLNEELIIGRPIIRLLPFEKAEVLPGIGE